MDTVMIPTGPMHIVMGHCKPSIQTFWENLKIICDYGADHYSHAALAYWYFPENVNKTLIDFENELVERGFTNFYLGTRKFNEDEEDDIHLGDYVPIKARYHLLYLWGDTPEFSLTDVAEEHKADRCLTFLCVPPNVKRPKRDPLIINAGILNAVPGRMEGQDESVNELTMLLHGINKLSVREVSQKMMSESFSEFMNNDDMKIVTIKDKYNAHGDVLIICDRSGKKRCQYGFQQLRGTINPINGLPYGFYILASKY